MENVANKKNVPDPAKQKKANQALGCGCLVLLLICAFGIWKFWSWISTPAQENTIDTSQYTANAESLSQLFTDFADFDYKNLKVQMLDNEGLSVCEVSYCDDQTSLDETNFVNRTIVSFVDFQELSYQIEGIDGVRFVISTGLTDERGNETETKVEQFLMYKDVYDLYDWENTQGSIFDQFKEDCAEFYIHPSILLNSDTDDIIYY